MAVDGSRTVWSFRDLRIVVLSRALSMLGDTVTFVALSLRVAESGEPPRMTALLIAFAVPAFALAGWAGRLIDRHDSRHLLVGAGLLQVGASAGLVWGPNLPAVIGFVVLLQAGQSVTGPTWAALLPRIVGEDMLGKAVGLQQSAASAAALVGTGLGGVLYDKLGYHRAVVLDTLTFAVLVVVGAGLRTRRGLRHDQRTGRDSAPASNRLERTSGRSYIRHDELLRLLVPALWIFILAAEGTNVVEVFLVTRELHASATMFGVVGLFFAAGLMLGPLLAGRVTAECRSVTVVGGSAASMGVLLALAGLAPNVWVLLPLFALAGFSNGVLNALCSTLVVLRTPDRLRGRVLASVSGSTRGFSVLALVLGGLGGQYLGARATFMVGGFLAALTSIPLLRSRGSDAP